MQLTDCVFDARYSKWLRVLPAPFLLRMPAGSDLGNIAETTLGVDFSTIGQAYH